MNFGFLLDMPSIHSYNLYASMVDRRMHSMILYAHYFLISEKMLLSSDSRNVRVVCSSSF